MDQFLGGKSTRVATYFSHRNSSLNSIQFIEPAQLKGKEMPNGPGDRAREKVRMMAEREINKKLQEQKWAEVRLVTNERDFQELMSNAADEEFILHSWTIRGDNSIVAIFIPGTEDAKDWQRRGGSSPF